MGNYRGKKCQLAIFMILGSVLLLGGVMYIFMSSSSAKDVQETARFRTAMLEEDARIFRSYFHDIAEDSVYKSLRIWGYSGGVNLGSTILPTETFELSGNERKIAYLYYQGDNVYDKDQSVRELKALIRGYILDRVDESVFTDRGYLFFQDAPPEVSVSFNEGMTSFAITPQFKLSKGNEEYMLDSLYVDYNTDISGILEEVNPIIDKITSDAFDSYTPPANVRVCAYDTSPSDEITLIRIKYNKPFKRYSSYQFDFLIEHPIALLPGKTSVCKS